MGHPWQKYVLGGVEHPQIYFIGENLFTNPGFETDTTGWTFSNLTGTKTSDSTTYYGNYSLKVDTIIGYPNYFWQNYPAVSQKIYIFTFFAKNNRNLREYVNVLIYSGTDYTEYYREIGPEWEQFSIVHTVSYKTAVEAKPFRIYVDPVTDYDPNMSISFDNFGCYLVSEHYELGEPQIYSQNFQKIKYAENELISGSLREYVKGWRYKAKLFYELETALQEKIRTKISNGSNMIFFPHKDSQFCQKVIWDDDKYERTYFKNKYLGYSDEITLKGTELIQKQPTDIVGIGGYAMDELSLPVLS